ncbi:hypothetical protein HK100_000049 [Physocladia obscura]|uniref:ABC transporter domain-containing protein n=1 Tax=Physocladia obscura TaxID=109957 RepID=A0AAD5T9M6_9FUNG|nr:hypothetical protein HK100_000049 [Physocladia obscura]
MNRIHFQAVVQIRRLNARREYLSIFSAIVFPVLMVTIAIVIATTIPVTKMPSSSIVVPLKVYSLPMIFDPSSATEKLNLAIITEDSSSSGLNSVLNPILESEISFDIGPNHLFIQDLSDIKQFIQLDTANLNSTSAPYYPGGFFFNSTLQEFQTVFSDRSIDLGYAVLVDSNRDSSIFPLLSSYIISSANALTGFNVSTPKIIPNLATIVTGKYIDLGSQIVPVFLTNALTFSIISIAESRVKDNEFGVISQIYLSGVHPKSFFLATAFVDGVRYLVAVAICISIMAAAGLTFIKALNIGLFVIPMLVFGIVVIPLGYSISFCFKSSTSVGTIGGSLLSVVVFVPYFIVEFIYNNEISAAATVGFSLIAPSFGLFQIFSALGMSVQSGSPYTVQDYFSFSHIMLPVTLVFLVQSALYTSVAALLFHLQKHNISFMEFMYRKRVATRYAEEALYNLESNDAQDDSNFPNDAQVSQERELLARMANNELFDEERNQIVIEGVGKIVKTATGSLVTSTRYGAKNLVILDNLWFSVKKGECFGFLGPNGAGKSTTMKILAGIDNLTSGRVRFSGNPQDTLTATKVPRFVTENIGYCPQHDALWPKITAREHLHFYATIRGVVNPAEAAASALETVGISEQTAADVFSETLSGGNRRRLMLAIAAIGSPKLLFLDEPTTGVDVAVRRTIWAAIEKWKTRCAIVLTSHSMEEVDALSDRIGILVNGSLRCLGTAQYLKSTHGSGYIVTLRIDNALNSLPTQQWFASEMDKRGYATKARKLIGCTLTFEVPVDKHTVEHSVELLGSVFEILKNKNNFGIFDFTVSQTTLQQVFIDFAKRQKEAKVF